MKTFNVCRTFCVACIACILLSGCFKNPTQIFLKNLKSFTNDKVVTDVEYDILKKSMPIGGCMVNGVQIVDESSLVAYLHNQGITESAKALTPEVPVDLYSMAIYLDISASMSGYSHSGNPSFTAPIIALPNAVNADVAITTNYIAREKGGTNASVKVLAKEEFERNLANGKVSKAESSPLDAIMSLIIDSTDINTVSCLITDGIISGTNEEIARDREFALKNMPLLEQRIREATAAASNKDLDMLVYRMETSFDGIYYDYRNTKHTIKIEDRPYFLIFIGHKSLLKGVSEALEMEADFIPTDKFATWEVSNYQTVDHGVIYKIPSCQAQYVLNIGKRALVFDKTPNVPVDFKVRLNLADLPKNYQSGASLLNNLELYYEVNGIEVEVNRFIQSITTYNATLHEFEVALQVDPAFFNEFSKERVIYLRHKASLENWWEDKSSESDIEMGKYPDAKTFALNKMMRGVLNGYGIRGDKMKDAICISIELKK